VTTGRRDTYRPAQGMGAPQKPKGDEEVQEEVLPRSFVVDTAGARWWILLVSCSGFLADGGVQFPTLDVTCSAT
jgi:hypothetical protein